jgi:hypothetical protein
MESHKIHVPNHQPDFIFNAKTPQIHHVNRSKLHFAVIIGRAFAKERVIPTSAGGHGPGRTFPGENADGTTSIELLPEHFGLGELVGSAQFCGA